ncbi:MAG: FtsX-like permease family protein [Lachnospiraceae bacterium]
MNNSLYLRLAFTNMKKHAGSYIPYLITCIISISMYYIIYALSKDPGLASIKGGTTLSQILGLSKYVLGFFSAVFLFYTYSFLIKRRKKEFGVYNILGMEKRHISRIMFFESFFSALISFVGGFTCAIVLSQLFYLALLKIIHFEAPVQFEFSLSALTTTLTLFAVIFVLSYLNTLRQIHLANPMELLTSSSSGEKEPKTKWVLLILGLICLGGGYYIAVTTESPLNSILLFVPACIAVMIGTYCLFTAGIIAFLKLLRKNKAYYYQTRHFISVSGMIYRMKQNAIGLSNICILSTAVLIMLSTTIALNVGAEDSMRLRYPRNITVEYTTSDENQINALAPAIQKILDEKSLQAENTRATTSRYFYVRRTGNAYDATTENMDSNTEISLVMAMTLSDYNQQTNSDLTLGAGELYVITNQKQFDDSSVSLNGQEYAVKGTLPEDGIENLFYLAYMDTSCWIVPDLPALQQMAALYDNTTAESVTLDYSYGFDLASDASTQTSLATELSDTLSTAYPDVRVESIEQNRSDFYSLYGGLLFIGLLLGGLFIITTILIIYYKQISEGYDDKERFAIMQKVGMSRYEVKKSIKSQVLTVFFLPLLVACIHVAFAFPIITRMLGVLGLSNIPLFIYCLLGTILAFAVLYALIYFITARSYYRIVSSTEK